MEFNSKKPVIYANKPASTGMVRHTPYPNLRGRIFIDRYKKRNDTTKTNVNTSPKSSPRRIVSRAEKIVNNSTSRTLQNGEESSLASRFGKKSTSPQGTKRPFSAVNGVDSNNSADPYDLFSDNDDFVADKKTNTEKDDYMLSSEDSDLDFFTKNKDNKENSLFSPARSGPKKVYPNKKKATGPFKNDTKSRAVYRLNTDYRDRKGFESENVPIVKKSYNFSIFSDSDSENVDKPDKTAVKEKVTFSPPPVKITVQKSNTLSTGTPKLTLQKGNLFNNKKTIDLSRSKLVNDFSPEKVEKAFGTKYSSSTAEKENVPTRVKELTSNGEVPVTLPYLIGFPNYGNTCYLNSVIQALFGLPSFVSDYQILASQLSMPLTSLSHGLIQVLYSRAKGQNTEVKHALRTVKENLVRVDGSFSGFKMQDANEFLTRILDTTKDEVDHCHMNTPSPNRVQEQDPSESLDEDLPLSGEKSSEVPNRSEAEGDMVSAMANTNLSTPPANGKTETEIETPRPSSSKVNEPSDAKLTSSSENSTPNNEVGVSRNPIKDNFEFQLLESYRCLGCGEVEGRKQEYFGLYVNLPEEGEESIQDAITAYMGADQRELKCAKCGHNQSSVVTSITRLPRILIVQLKRYEYKPLLGESVKVSSRVQVNRWLSLDSHMSSDVTPPSSWDPNAASHATTPRAPKQATLTVRNLSSELNVCEKYKDSDDLPDLGSPVKASGTITLQSSADKEDEELQEVMRQSMEDVGGVQEEDELQQAIRLSLQDQGMNYSQENQAEVQDEDSSRCPQVKDDEAEQDNHAYRLISIISHFGVTTNTGHYVADVYNCDDDTWRHYDDECVSKIPESVVFAEGRQKNGYIFFYIHKDLLKIEDKSSPPPQR